MALSSATISLSTPSKSGVHYWDEKISAHCLEYLYVKTCTPDKSNRRKRSKSKPERLAFSHSSSIRVKTSVMTWVTARLLVVHAVPPSRRLVPDCVRAIQVETTLVCDEGMVSLTEGTFHNILFPRASSGNLPRAAPQRL